MGFKQSWGVVETGRAGSPAILAREESSLLCLKMVTTWTEVREAKEADELGTQVADQPSK